jgi:CHAT domain-containing protein
MPARLLLLSLLAWTPLAPAAAPPGRVPPERRGLVAQRDWLRAEFQRLGRLGQREDASVVLLKRLEIERRLFGPVSSPVLASLYRVTILHEGTGAHGAALEARRETARVIERLYGADHYRAIDARWEVVAAQQRLNLTAAQLADHRELFRLTARVNVLFHQGRPDAAIPWALRRVELAKKLWGAKAPNTIHAINNVGVLYLDKGDLARARRYLDEAGRLYREVLGENHPAFAAHLANCASLHEAMKDGQRGLELAERAVRIFRDADGAYSSRHAVSLNTLAVTCIRLGDLRRARDLLEESVAIRDLLGSSESADVACLHNLGALYHRLGDRDRALKLHERGLEVSRRALGTGHLRYADGLDHLAVLHLEAGRPATALRLAERAHEIRLALLGEKHPDRAISLAYLCQIDLARGRLDRAVVWAGQALRVSFAHLEGNVAALSGRQRLDYTAEATYYLNLYLTVAGEQVGPAAQYEWVARHKGLLPGLLAEERLGLDEPRIAGLLDQLRQARAGLARLAADAPSPDTAARWRQAFDRTEQRKEELEVELAQASRHFAALRQRPTARAVAAALPEGAALVEFLVHAHGTSRHDGQRRLLAFVLRNDRAPVRVLLGDMDRIQRLIRAWRAPIVGELPTDPTPAVAAQLRARLWAPVEKHLGGARTVLIAPDDELHRLPFAALPGRAPGTFLLEDYALASIPSGRQLLGAPPQAPGGVAGLLALGGLDYGPSRSIDAVLARPRNWGMLPGAAVEVAQVAAAFRRAFPSAAVTRLSGKASRSNLLAGLERRPRFLHLATHGHFDEVGIVLDPARGAVCAGAGAQPGLPALGGVLAGLLVAERGTPVAVGMDLAEQSRRTYARNPLLLTSLVLSGVNGGGDEGYLTAEEIAALDLRGCELAVLSACETALGRLAAWQGMLGLQQGFHQAGVRHVLASLWSVSDPATSVLMEEFYHQLWVKQQAPREALRQAQLTVLRDPERVRKRMAELRRLLVNQGLPETLLASRGLGKRALALPAGPARRRAPIAWWGAWVLSGLPR